MNERYLFLSVYSDSSRIDISSIHNRLIEEKSGQWGGCYIGALNVHDRNAKLKTIDELRKLSADGMPWISVDGFFPKKSENGAGERTLLLLPNNRLFEKNWNGRIYKEMVSGFQQVAFTSSYWYEKLEKYSGSGARLIRDIQPPFLQEMKNTEKCDAARESLECVYPEVKGKKILYIYVDGKPKRDAVKSYIQFPMEEVLKKLPEDWILVTNCVELRRASVKLSARLRSGLIYITRNYDREDLLLCADALISNISYQICYFATMGRPYAVLKYCNNIFESYAEANTRGEYCATAAELESAIEDITNGSWESAVNPQYIFDGQRDWSMLL